MTKFSLLFISAYSVCLFSTNKIVSKIKSRLSSSFLENFCTGIYELMLISKSIYFTLNSEKKHNMLQEFKRDQPVSVH